MKKGLVKAAVVGAAIVIIAGLTAVVISVKSSRQRQAEVAKGVEVIRNMETVDATQIENKALLHQVQNPGADLSYRRHS